MLAASPAHNNPIYHNQDIMNEDYNSYIISEDMDTVEDVTNDREGVAPTLRSAFYSIVQFSLLKLLWALVSLCDGSLLQSRILNLKVRLDAHVCNALLIFIAPH